MSTTRNVLTCWVGMSHLSPQLPLRARRWEYTLCSHFIPLGTSRHAPSVRDRAFPRIWARERGCESRVIGGTPARNSGVPQAVLRYTCERTSTVMTRAMTYEAVDATLVPSIGEGGSANSK